MEMVVVIAIFSALILIALNVFILALHAQRQTSFRQQVLANLRYVMESMAQKVRTSEIDYQFYLDDKIASPDGKIANPENVLALINQAGNHLQYSVKNGVIYQSDGQSSFALTEPSQVLVTKFDFYISPATNPFAEERCNGALESNTGCKNDIACTINDSGLSDKPGFCICTEATDCLSNNCEPNEELGVSLCLPFDSQPGVTIVLGFQSVAQRVEEIKTLYLQTTVSSRVYKR